MLYRVFLSLTCLLAIANSAYSQVRLEQKIEEGASHTSTTSQTIDQKLTIAGMEIDTNVETSSTSKSTSGKRDASGTLRVKEKIESLQINMNTQGQQYMFDSANPDNKGTSALEPLREIHKAVSKHESTTVYDKDNRITAVEIDQNLVGSLPVEVQQLVKSQLDPENLKMSANQERDRIPSDPVNKGDTWVRTENVNFGAGQEMSFQNEYKYEGTIEKDGKTLDKITSKVLTVTFGLKDSPLPLTLKGSDLKAAESQSTLLFDRAAGRVVESDSSLRVTGDLTFEVNNMELPSKLDLKMKSTSATTK